jgi:hypothetical protein
MDGIGPIDPDPGANTSNRYQNGASADPVPSTSTCPAGAPQGRELACATSTDTRNASCTVPGNLRRAQEGSAASATSGRGALRVGNVNVTADGRGDG